jgi:thiol-disulfide isomerase/thioredoxin
MRSRKAILAAVLLATLSAGSSRAAGGAEGMELSLESAAGGRVSLARFAGRTPVLLVFWATWCPHCNAAVPAINDLQSRLSGRVQILAIDYMESREKVKAFMKAKKIAYPVLLDSDGKAARTFRVAGIPTYILLDREGRIVYFDNVLPPALENYL